MMRKYHVRFGGGSVEKYLQRQLATFPPYFSLSELEALRGPFGLAVERDLYFKPMPLSQIRKEYAR